MAGERAGDHGDLGGATLLVGDDMARDVLIPQHREVGLDHLVGGRQVDPDLEQLGRVRAVAVEEREHLGVLDALAGGHPLHVAAAVAGGGTHRVGVVDEALTDERDRLEATVRVDGEAGHGAAVVHAPAVDAFEVVADRPAVERCDRAEVGVAGGVVVEMVDAEQERVDGRPLEPQRDGLDDGRTHSTSLAEMLANATKYTLWAS